MLWSIEFQMHETLFVYDLCDMDLGNKVKRVYQVLWEWPIHHWRKYPPPPLPQACGVCADNTALFSLAKPLNMSSYIVKYEEEKTAL